MRYNVEFSTCRHFNMFGLELLVVSDQKSGPREVSLDAVANDKEYHNTVVLKFLLV